jgi:O-antigen/teichoic acid export membrane protein
MANSRSFESALKWSYTANWGERGLAALFTIVLAGILGPQDFGTVAIALIYINFLQMFLDQGFLAALIQRKELDDEHLNAVFWVNQLLSLVLVGLSVLLSGWWAVRNHTPELTEIIFALSLCIPIEGLSAVQVTLMKREMDFRSLSIRSNISVLVGGAVGVATALTGFRVWALVAQQLARDLSALALLWNLSPWRPRWRFSWPHLKSLMNFSVSNFVAQLAVFADLQGSSIVLGLFFGPVAVGLYRIADRVTGCVAAVATSSIQTVSFPEFARLQDKPHQLRQSVMSCIRLSSAVMLPLAGLLGVSTPLMAVLGPKWIPAAGVLRILSVIGMLFVFDLFTGPLLQARSMPHRLALLAWARVLVGTGILVAAGMMVRNGPLKEQIIGIALARFVLMAFLITPVYVYILIRLCDMSLRDFTSSLVPSMIASGSILVSLMLVHASGWLSGLRPLVVLIAEALIGATVGLAVLFQLDEQLRKFFIGMLQRPFGQVTSKESV